MDFVSVGKKPHAVCVPLPFQSHINAMLKLAKLLHFKGYHITFVNSLSNHEKLVDSKGGADSLELLTDFRFETLPDGPNIMDFISNFQTPFRSLVAQLNQAAPNHHPPVSCIVADAFMSATLPFADELGIPQVLYWPCSAAVLIMQLHLLEFARRVLPLKGTDGYPETPIDYIPGMKDIQVKHASSGRAAEHDVNALNEHIQQACKASAMIINTFDALESDVLEAIKSKVELPVYTLGPLPLMEQQIPNNQLKSFRSNLSKEEEDCLEWLNTKQANSVIYVNFGTHAVLTSEQLVEFAWGLANSKHPFLWVIRPDLVIGEAAVLPPEFSAETTERGMISGWCPQEEVLCHSSVGGFLTHSGWNSTLDTVCAGVPVICWPFENDQPLNCRYTCFHWGTGMELGKDVKRDTVEELVRELMQGNKGKELKKRALEWKNSAQEATRPGGSSSVNLDNIVKQVLLSKKLN